MIDNLILPFDTSLGLHAVIGLIAGLLLGLAHFSTLHWNLQALTHHRLVAALALQLTRLGLLAAAMTLLAQWGAVMLLSATLAILFARRLVLRRVGSLS